MSSLEVAVVGYGLAGAVFHAPLIAAEPRMRVAAVVTGSAERAEQARRAHDGVRVFPDVDTLFEDIRGIDLVVVATPNRTHAPLAARALDAGIPVVVDKPFAVTVGEAEEVVAHAERAGVALSVFQNRRWDGDFRTVRELVEGGGLGAVRRFESRFERWRPVSKGGWREVGSAADGAGLLFDLGSHLVDQALTLFGPVHSVYGELDRRRPGIQTDDDVFLALTHENGVRSHLWMSAVAPQLGPRFRVLGADAGYVTYGLDPQEDALRAGRDPREDDWGTVEPERWGWLGAEPDLAPHPTLPGDYPAFYAEMAAAILDGTPVPVDPRDAVAALRVLTAARRSAESGTAQRV
ncbi:Predicted dehydrogenase [Nocardia amikacinitolerans]|uniref:Predicted dehydrogenase n=1 Tax=Nocardia amikacinitolerans TaxID=756689 RepID=A0A285KRH9_9NOCA|nr:Gfo/Idh/MocA family oxidoreductase [Nocardia amikacinitolerans]MCP2275506.1 putative dehydrogenase [Nocardia amikacinitolerans]MCP2293766.1 putative dehydrogenase [Nocardia amikacinitolerans]SNY74813.1 Predicted dehydrogenase [Nocardia amikacinitolerans]